jgi:lysozyme family protein
MAIFKDSYPIIEANEGGYANNPRDNGKETYCGISRKYHPDWGGWQFIDKFKAKGVIKNNTIFDSLISLVKGFYMAEYWEKLYLAYFHQDLASQLFDFAVNSGKGRATKELQKILNRSGFRLKVDGALGKKTAQAVQSVDNKHLAVELFKARKAFIEAEIKNQPHFANVWRNRLNYLKGFLSSPDTQVVFGIVGIIALGLILKNT